MTGLASAEDLIDEFEVFDVELNDPDVIDKRKFSYLGSFLHCRLD